MHTVITARHRMHVGGLHIHVHARCVRAHMLLQGTFYLQDCTVDIMEPPIRSAAAMAWPPAMAWLAATDWATNSLKLLRHSARAIFEAQLVCSSCNPS